jgi:hypothetical protein
MVGRDDKIRTLYSRQRRMIKRLKDIWSDPRDIQEAEWYILFGVFVIVWMWVILIMSP